MFRRSVFLVAISLGTLFGRAAAQANSPLDSALAWLKTMQRSDGGFSNGFSDVSDPGTTADIGAALAQAGIEPSSWENSGSSMLDFLQASVAADALTGNPGMAAKFIRAALPAGMDITNFAGVDLIAEVTNGFDSGTGLFGSGPYDSALAVWALAEAQAPIPDGALEGLLASRLDDGSYSFSGDRTPGAGDSNTTAVAVLALSALGQTDAVDASLGYLQATQNEDGGWTYQKPGAFGEDTDANSTALVILALDAAGEDLAAWGDPAGALLALQQEDGSFAFNAVTPGANLLATVGAIPALVVAAAQTPPATPTQIPTQPPTSVPPAATVEAAPTQVPAQTGAPGASEGLALAAVALVITLGAALWLGRRSGS